METKSRASSLKKKRKIFGWLFLSSILVFFASSMFILESMPQTDKTAPPDNGGPLEPSLSPPVQAVELLMPGTAVVSVVSLLTSITSLVGFFSTTVLAWRKEKREAVTAKLEIKKKELELEKLRVELAKSEESKKNESA